MAKLSRAAEAARGTRLDPDRAVSEKDSGGDGSPTTGRPDSVRPATRRERITMRMFAVITVLLVAVPLVMVAYLWTMGGGSLEGLRDAMAQDPQTSISFLSAMCQAFVAWMLTYVRRHYEAGDGGYAAANLVGLICGEVLLMNAVGALGCAALLWRVWRNVSGELSPWLAERGLGGKLLDLSGSLVVIVMGAICAFATWRVGAA